MPEFKERPTILQFGTDHAVLLFRVQQLKQMGFRMLQAANGFEAIQLAIHQRVDAVLLDQDRNCAEIELVATQIQRYRPQVPMILITEGVAPPGPVRQLATALVRKRDNLGMLLAALENALASSGEPPQVRV